MTIYKSKDITTHIENEKQSISNPDTHFYTEDIGTVALRFFMNWNGTPLDLNKINMKPELDLFHSDGSIWLEQPIQIVMAEKGTLQYNVPKNVISHAGKVQGKLFLKNETESIHVSNFTFKIEDSGIDGVVGKEIDVPLLEDIIEKIVSENAMELLGESFKEEVTESLQGYVLDNAEIFKGPQGDEGPAGDEGDKGDKGDKGDSGVATISNVDIALLNGITTPGGNATPKYTLVDYGGVKTIMFQGSITNIPTQKTIYVGVLPLKPNVDVFVDNSYNGVSFKVMPTGTISVNTPSTWKPEYTLSFNGSYTI